MKHSKKYIISSFLVGASFVFLNIPCFSVSAIEISVGEQAGIDDYLSTYGENQGLIEVNYRVDEDGNKDAHIAILGLQRVALTEQTKIYDNMNFSIAPSSVSVSGSASTGFYYFDNVLYTGVLYPRPDNWSVNYGASGYEPVCSTPHFTVGITMEPVNGVTYSRGGNGYLIASGGNGMFKFDASAVFQSFTINSSGAQAVWLPSSNAPRYYSSSTLLNLEDYFWNRKQFISSGASVSLPSGSVNTSRPWDYYNNVLLPYIETNYGDIVDYRDFLVFPDGYEPPAQPSTVPVEYPTSPTFDLGLIEDGTQPTGAETANYELPQFETKTVGVPVFDLNQFNPTQIIAPVSRGLSGIWALVTDILSSFGLFPLVTLSLLVSVIGALLLLGK